MFTRIVAGEEIELAGSRWRVLVGEGHAPEQVTLHCAERNLLLAADQILPRISPVIGVWAAEPAADPLGDFLRSLGAVPRAAGGLPRVAVAGLPFLGLHERLDQLALHHEERLDRTLAACAEPATAAAVLRSLFTRPLDAHQTGFALAETLAHLNRLVELGRCDAGRTSDGVLLYRALC